jgi:hypothetical protein
VLPFVYLVLVASQIDLDLLLDSILHYGVRSIVFICMSGTMLDALEEC